VAYLGLCGMLATRSRAFMGWRKKKGERRSLVEQDQNMHIFMFPLAKCRAEGEGKVSSHA